jgi:hypothetical protein
MPFCRVRPWQEEELSALLWVVQAEQSYSSLHTERTMPVLLWLLGVPLSVVILLLLFGVV